MVQTRSMTNADDSHRISIIDAEVDWAIAKDKGRGRAYERFVDFNTRMHKLHRPRDCPGFG